MPRMITTDYFDQELIAGITYNPPLAEDDFSLQADGRINRADYVMTVPARGGPTPANFVYPLGIATHVVPFGNLYGGTDQFNPWPCPGWFHNGGQAQVSGGVCVAGGGPHDATNNNDFGAYANLACHDVDAEIEFTFAAADAEFSLMAGVGNTIGVVWLNLRSNPSNVSGQGFGNNRIAAVADGTSASVWATNSPGNGGLQNVVAAPMADGTRHILGLRLVGQAYTLSLDRIVIDAGTLPVGPTLQIGADQRPFDWSIYGGFELYRPAAGGGGGPGPPPLTAIHRITFRQAGPLSPYANALLSAGGDVFTDERGNIETWG